MSLKLYIILVSFFVPAIAFADIPTTPETISDIFTGFSIGNMEGLIPSLILIAVVTFFAGVLKFVGAGDNEEKRQSGRQVMVFGIVVLFVMVSYWGFVNILTDSFFNDEKGIPNYLPELLN